MNAKCNPGPSRRSFIKRAAMTASAALAVPTIIPRHVLASDSSPGANDRINVGIIGMGMRGDQLTRNIPNSGRVVAICDADLRKTDEVTKKNQADWRVYQDYRKLIDQKDIDAVMVATVDHHHVLASILACQAGKDVYCEKPLSLYLREGRALVDAARKYQRVVQTGTQQRTMEMNQFACEFVRDGGIGDIRAVECVNFRGPNPYPAKGLPAEPIPQGVNWDLWQGQAPVHPFHHELFQHWTVKNGRWWGNWRDYANSQVTGMGAHAYDMVQYALGADETGPVEFWPVDEGPQARVDFRYANGVQVRLSFPDKEPRRGPQLGAVFTGSKCKMEINRNKYTTNPPDFVSDPPDPELAAKWEGDDLIARGHVDNWFDCIRSREKPNADVEIGHRTASISHLIVITRMLGRRLQWDPEKETFPNDDEANALLDRPRRKGWDLPDIG
ncbi:Inositol 2-dehydrogenase [Crateriforma conspicua]|nr:Inositol 2-dehydrogenase [Crateriforma conspicua]